MNKALFLDRDGIINVDHGYVYQKEQFEFVDGIFELCRIAKQKGYIIIVITNQSGIGRGLYTEKHFETLTEWMAKQFKSEKAEITDVYFCPHHPTKGIGKYLKICECRKPQPKLITNAAKDHNVSLDQSIFIGDKPSDMEAAQAAGIENRILVSSQYHNNDDVNAISINNIKQACTYIN